jgi:protein-tyrosine kinase
MEQLHTFAGRSTESGGASRAIAPAIGTLLRDAGLLTPERIERIAKLQQRDGGLFGQLAVRLYGLSEHDVEQALAHQFGQHRLRPGHDRVSSEVLAAYQPGAAQLAPVRQLRSHLQVAQRGMSGHPTYAITSAGRGDGRTVLSANLAVLLAHLGQRTLLIDADLHHPRQHLLFGLNPHRGLSSVLGGAGAETQLQAVPGLPQLTLLAAGVAAPNPHELLARPAFAQLMRRLGQQFDTIIVDTPANGVTGDAQAIAMACGRALVLARQDASASAATAALIAELSAAQVGILGCVLNAA